MTLRIISPEEVVYEGQVDSVTLPGQSGAFTVLRGHAALVAALSRGAVAYRPAQADPSAPKELAPVDGGLVSVQDDVVTVCVY